MEAIRQEKETKVIQIDRETVKVLLCSDNTIIHIKTPKDYNKKLPKVINEFSKSAGYKINIQKFVPFLYSNKEKLRKQLL